MIKSVVIYKKGHVLKKLVKNMFLEIGIVLIVLWILGFTFYPLGGLIHLLLVLAIISIVWNFVSGRRVSR